MIWRYGKYILENLGPENVSILYQDNYYKKREDQQKDNNGHYNFDLPSSFHQDEFFEDIRKIKAGEKVWRKEYTFNNPEIIPSKILVSPNKIILVEGLFLFNEIKISNLFDRKIFIDCNIQKMIERRIKRDHEMRGYDKSDVNYKYENHVLPSYKNFILPYKKTADLVINNDSDNLNGAKELINNALKLESLQVEEKARLCSILAEFYKQENN